eukprot:505465-Pyramimonas_sp.AAC.1
MAAASGQSRLDTFHCRCLHNRLGITRSFYSRVSNKTVLERASAIPLSTSLADKQVQLYKRIGYSGNGC